MPAGERCLSILSTLSILSVLFIATPSHAQFETTEVSALGAEPLLISKQQWSWEDLSPSVPEITYNVFRRMPGDGFRCIQSRIRSSSWTGDAASPPPGGVWWYTVNGDDTWVENRHGSGVDVVERCPCSGTLADPATDLTVELVGMFDAPMHLTAPRSDRTRIYVALRDGIIEVMDLRDQTTSVFLDISSQVRTCGEQGLLSLAFHPEFASNRRFFVYYTAPGGSFGEGVARIVEFVALDADTADPSSERLIYESDRPTCFHNGGQIAFGPDDGHLYIGLGDGDTPDRAQDLSSELGKMLRLDVDSGSPYAVPADNPFVGVAGTREEIWSYGLRNPWRFSLDRATGNLYVGDVGDSCVEEVSVGFAVDGGGENYGWNLLEGTHCASSGICTTPCATCPPVSDCSVLTPPIAEFDRNDVPGGCSVIGGHRYRGCRLPSFIGRYFYSDWCENTVWSFELAGRSADNLRQWSFTGVWQPVSFGEDARGELYIVTSNGRIHRIIGN